MEEFLARMLGILIVGIIVIVAHHIEAERDFKRWKAFFGSSGPSRLNFSFTFKGVEPTIEAVFRTSDRFGREIGDVYYVGTDDHYTIHVWDGKSFVTMGTSEPLKEEAK